MPLPGRALAILRRQDALITRNQLMGLDVPRSTIDTWVYRGVLERVDREVYRRPGAACRRTLIDLDRLLGRAVELGQHRGAVAVRHLFASGLLDQDGELERQLALLLDEAGLRPAWGMEVLPGIVVDACFPDALYVIECDGRLWHRIDADRAADATRQGVLEADGWRVDRVRHEDLTGDRVAVLARVRATRAARAAAGLRRPDGWRPVRAGRRVRPPNFGADVDAAGAVGGG